MLIRITLLEMLQTQLKKRTEKQFSQANLDELTISKVESTEEHLRLPELYLESNAIIDLMLKLNHGLTIR